MKDLKRKLAVLLTLCLVLTGAVPAYAEEMMLPETAEIPGIAEEASPAEAEYGAATPFDAEYEATEKDPEVFPEDAELRAEKAEDTNDGIGTETVQYIDEHGQTQTQSCTIFDYRTYGLTNGWYVADGKFSFIHDINITGNVCLILKDSCKISASTDTKIILDDNASLTLYGQKNGTGVWSGSSFDKHPASNISLTINGGNLDTNHGSANLYNIVVNRGSLSAGSINGSTSVTINGGKMTAAYGLSGGTITINGGEVKATGGDEAAGIGGGWYQSGGTVIINGGTVTATGGKMGAGIGGGYRGNGGSVTITGGTVNATGGHDAAGIGGGYGENGGSVIITGGTVTATGGDDAAGIGGGKWGEGGTLTVENVFNIYSGESGDYAHSTTVTDYVKSRDRFVHMSAEIEEYTVIHQLQKTDAIGYEENEREVIYGVPGTRTKAKQKNYDGFSCEGITNVDIAADGTTEVPIKYRRNLYDITFDNNGIGSATEKITALYGASVTIDPQAPSAAGYEFSGWFEDQLCTKSFTTPQTIEMPLGGKTLYAKWTPIEYTVMWKDGNKVLKTDKVAYGKTPYYGPDPKKEGYEFVSWWPAIQKVTGDAIYNAIFYKPSEKHTITWMLNDIQLIDQTEVTEGEMPVHENPEIDGYIFVGWQPALAPVTGDAKYTAYFVQRGEERVAVRFNTDGGSFIETQVIGKDSIPERPADPEKTGYTFEGWYREAGFITPYNFNEPVNTDMTLYAKWTKTPVKKYEISWFLNDIKLIDTTEVAEGEMPVHENPEIDGYIFIGWQPAITPATGNRDYIAHFEERGENKVAVTFNTGGGTFINTQIINKDSIPERPADPEKTGYTFEGWYREAGFITPYNFNEPVNTDMTLYARWKVFTKSYTITWKDWNGTVLATSKVVESGLPKYPGASKPSRSGYIFTGWTPEIDLAAADATYTATYEPKSSGGGGGGGGSAPAVKNAAVTFSPNWYADGFGVWRIRNSAGQVVTNAWLCDDAVTANGQNVWYLLTQDGAMLASGLVQDNTGNFYSLETNHDGYFGMLRYTDGYYNCNGQQVYLKFSHEHNGTFGAITNTEGLEKLKAIYGVTKYGIGNENAVYTKTF